MQEIVKPREIADAIGTSTNNIYQSYRNNPSKQHFYENWEEEEIKTKK